jgi:hypothetical protein
MWDSTEERAWVGIIGRRMTSQRIGREARALRAMNLATQPILVFDHCASCEAIVG